MNKSSAFHLTDILILIAALILIVGFTFLFTPIKENTIEEINPQQTSCKLFAGKPQDLVNNHIPQKTLQKQHPESFTVDISAKRQLTSRTRLMLIFNQNTTVEQANKLLCEINATLASSSSKYKIVIIDIPDNPQKTLEPVKQAQSKLKESGLVEDVKLDRVTKIPEDLIGILQSCKDGTKEGECSINKPQFCKNGRLVDRCDLCGCEGIKVCNPNTLWCVSDYAEINKTKGSCSDYNVSEGQCVLGMYPFYCQGGVLVQRCDLCGCGFVGECNNQTKICEIPQPIV